MGILRYLRRRRLLRQELPREWMKYLDRHAKFYHSYPQDIQVEFLRRLRIFVAEKQFIPALDMAVTDEVKVVIAACALRLIVGLDLSYYDRLTEIVVYPEDYRRPGEEEGMLGEAQDWGVIVLSWDAVLKGLRGEDDGIDTATHEFAHVLDRADGEFDGTPKLRTRKDYKPWREVMTRHYKKLCQGKSPQIEVLDEYGAESEAEFFAVATEAFFERPGELREHLPDLYRELKRFYGVDPAK